MLQSVTIYHPSKLPADIMTRWQAALCTQASWANPFLTPEFALAVGKQRRDARIIVAHDENARIGILGIHKCKGGYARPLGAPLSDHQAFITEPGFNADMKAIMADAGLSVFAFTALNDPKTKLQTATQKQDIAHIANLSGGIDEFFTAQESAHRKHFKKMRQRTRNAIRDHGKVDFQLDSRDSNVFELLMQWKHDQFRRTRKCDILASNWISTLLHRLWSERGPVRAVLNVIYFGDKPAAAEIGLVSAGIYHSWIVAYDPAFARYSPGLLLLEGIMRRADTMGIEQVDLGVGHDHYKKYYANDGVPLGAGKVLGDGFAARRHQFIDTYGKKFFADIPGRLMASHDFMAACHPHWRTRMDGFAQRLKHIFP